MYAAPNFYAVLELISLLSVLGAASLRAIWTAQSAGGRDDVFSGRPDRRQCRA